MKTYPLIFIAVAGLSTTTHAQTTTQAPVTTVLRPRITQVAPTEGTAGTRIVISGHNFATGDEVWIGLQRITTVSVEPHQIIATVDDGTTTGRLSVRRTSKPAWKPSWAIGNFVVRYLPRVDSYAPLGGPPGTKIQFRGKYFTTDARVLLGTLELPIINKVPGTELVVQLPSNAKTAKLIIVTNGGTWSSNLPFDVAPFPVLKSFFPNHGPVGTQLTIMGENFHPEMKLWLGSTQLPVMGLTNQKVVVSVPQGVVTGRITLWSRGRNWISSQIFTVDNPSASLSFSFSPPRAYRGDEVVLTLSSPQQDATVYYNGRPLPRRVLDGGQRLVVTVPGDATPGYFELSLRGQRYKATQALQIIK